jgi:hypothetical protein
MRPVDFGQSAASDVHSNAQQGFNLSPVDITRNAVNLHITTANLQQQKAVCFPEICNMIDNNLGQNSINAEQLKQEFKALCPDQLPPQ